MNILIACEESQIVAIECRLLGHNAFSCDIQDCSGGFPQWHIKGDCLSLLNGCTTFCTLDGTEHFINSHWDLIIAHPPCTFLSSAGNRHFNNNPDRIIKRELAANFFMCCINADCEHIAVENPVGYMNSYYRKPDQIINPYQFGDPYLKRTCFWLKNLPLLIPDYQVSKPEPVYVQPNGKKRYWVDTVSGSDRQRLRSKTFSGIARAMAWQWTNNFYF